MRHRPPGLRPQLDFSFIGPETRLDGSLLFRGKVLMGGDFRGEINGEGRLEIAETGRAEGDMRATEFVNYGHTRGLIRAERRVELGDGCHHRGDVATPKMKISPAARFEGRSVMPDVEPTPAPKPLFSKQRMRIAAGLALVLAAGAAAAAMPRESPEYFWSIWGRLDAVWEAKVRARPESGEREGPGPAAERRRKEHIAEAIRHEGKGEFEQAAISLRKALEVEGGGNRSVARYLLAKVLARRNRVGDAIREARALLADSPGHIEGMILLGDLYVRSGRLPEALETYREAFRREPEDVVLKRRLEAVAARVEAARPKAAASARRAAPAERIFIDAERLISEKRPAEAARLLRDAIKKAADSARLHFLLGAALVEMNRTGEAVRAYKKVVSLSPDWLDGYVRLGALLEAQGRDREAISVYEKAGALDPDDVDMPIRIARLHKSRGRKTTARRMLGDLVKKRPRSSLALVELGDFLWESGQAEESKKALRRALEIDGNSARALNRLAWFHATEKKDIERGIRLSKRSLEIQPDTPAYLDTLAELHYLNGQSVKALPLIQRAIELEPGNRYFRVQLEKFKRASRK